MKLLVWSAFKSNVVSANFYTYIGIRCLYLVLDPGYALKTTIHILAH